MPEEYDIIYRKCSRKEATEIRMNRGLTSRKKAVRIHGIAHGTAPNKWVSHRRSFVQDYKPKGVDPQDYEYCVVFKMEPGTIEELQKLKSRGTVRKGPRAAYGIPQEMVDWFNDRVVDMESYNTRTRHLPFYDGLQTDFNILRNKAGEPVTFAAFSPEHIAEIEGIPVFDDSVNLYRTSWIKTSLLWTLARSGIGTKEGQETILGISLPEAYLDNLVEKAVSTSENSVYDEVMYQRDPDRGLYFDPKCMHAFGGFSFRRRGKTVNFGLKGATLERFVHHIAFGNITILNDKLGEVLDPSLALEDYTSALYDRLELTPDTYRVERD